MDAYRISRFCLLTHNPARCRRASDLLLRCWLKSGNRAMLELAHAMVELAHAQRYALIGADTYARDHADRHMCLCRRAVRIAAGDSSRETR